MQLNMYLLTIMQNKWFYYFLGSEKPTVLQSHNFWAIIPLILSYSFAGECLYYRDLFMYFLTYNSTAVYQQINPISLTVRRHRKDFFCEFAEKNNYNHVCIYIDEGISGMKVRNQYEFQQFMKDARTGMFEMVIVKPLIVMPTWTQSEKTGYIINDINLQINGFRKCNICKLLQDTSEK